MDFEDIILKEQQRLTQLEEKPFRNRKEIQAQKVKISTIQAIEEGQAKDVLTSQVTGTSISNVATPVIDKNNYGSYSGQVRTINEMYNNRTDYGGEIIRACIDMRVSFLMGGGITVLTQDKTVSKWIEEFLNYNRLQGSALLENGTIGEMEGKDLMVISPIKKDMNIRVRNYSYYKTPYDVIEDEKDNQKIKKIVYQKNIQDAGQDIAKPQNAVYVKLGGSPDRLNRTPPRMANVLTDIENASRAKYDLRKNNHLFGRVTPYFETPDDKSAKSLMTRIQAIAWKIGRSIAGNAKFNLVEPTGNGSKVLSDEMTLLMKIVSMNTGIPLQYLAYPDVLSNRAVAETMIETVAAMTIKERMIWEEAFKELIQKAMAMAFENGYIKWNKPDSFEVKLTLISYSLLKQVIETYIPLADAGYISQDTVRTLIPGINPYKEKELIGKEKDEEIEKFKSEIDFDMQEDDMENDDVSEDKTGNAIQ